MTSTNVSQYSCQTRYKRLRSSLLVATALQLVSVATAVAQEGGIEEVVVTSNRRAEVLSKVPISVAAYTNESMAQNGVKQLSDLVRLTPGLVVSNSSQNSGNSISIRGIASTAGSATTGIYIDDTPIQAAALGTGGYGQIYPAVFDLDRVEVLRGPQGTLFGAGSEGGTVRFIQAQPSLSDFTIKARAEVNSVGKDGSTGYEYGLAGGGPILNSVLGFRVSAYYKKQGGWIDEISLRVMDALRVFPSIILALAIVSATGQTLANVVLVIGILDVPVFARLVRAEVLALRAGGFVEAAVNAGNPTWRILFVHLLPNCMRGALAQMPIRMAWAVRVSATLAFIGVGIQVPTPEWGAMIRQGSEFIISGEWWVSIVPGITLVLLVIGFSMLGDGFEEVLDPRRNTRAR